MRQSACAPDIAQTLKLTGSQRRSRHFNSLCTHFATPVLPACQRGVSVLCSHQRYATPLLCPCCCLRAERECSAKCSTTVRRVGASCCFWLITTTRCCTLLRSLVALSICVPVRPHSARRRRRLHAPSAVEGPTICTLSARRLRHEARRACTKSSKRPESSFYSNQTNESFGWISKKWILYGKRRKSVWYSSNDPHGSHTYSAMYLSGFRPRTTESPVIQSTAILLERNT